MAKEQKYTLKKLQRGPYIKLFLSVTRSQSDNKEFETETINIGTGFQLAQCKFMLKGLDFDLQIRMKMKSMLPQFEKPHLIKIICEDFQENFTAFNDWVETDIIKKRKFDSHFSYLGGYDDDIHLNGGYDFEKILLYAFEVNFTIQPMSATPTSMVTHELYKDEEFTDFKLQGTDGAVSIHKAVLLAHSDLFKTMFRSDEWTETKKSCLQMEATVATLQHLKSYIYLNILPETGLEPLLLLACCYLMDKLKTDCSVKMVQMVQPKDIKQLIKFSCENNMPELVQAMLMQIPDETLTFLSL